MVELSLISTIKTLKFAQSRLFALNFLNNNLLNLLGDNVVTNDAGKGRFQFKVVTIQNYVTTYNEGMHKAIFNAFVELLVDEAFIERTMISCNWPRKGYRCNWPRKGYRCNWPRKGY